MRYRIAMLFGMLTLAAAAPLAAEPAAVACEISAIFVDQDANGSNVRAAPSAAARVLGVIRSDVGTVAAIRGQRGTWFRVANVTDVENDVTLFQGDGWVHSSLLTIDTTGDDPRLYAGPGAHSRILRTLVPDETPLTLIGCSGRWAKVRAQGRVGWLSPSGQCSNPLTTCA